ncbi:hypothetical protein PR048_007879 [Dryococelus australis]|uniref:Uncharacterized protein n=1 Tax=Dryococelus australis TaxID=614101 RepID=A0ABQ9HVI0_9NEOP|nr:hypothetical protein PR048_007879 [Dryococelus australis]
MGEFTPANHVRRSGATCPQVPTKVEHVECGNGEEPECKFGENGRSRVNPPTNGIVQHDSHLRKFGVTRPAIEPGSPWWEASSLTDQPPWPLARLGQVLHSITGITYFCCPTREVVGVYGCVTPPLSTQGDPRCPVPPLIPQIRLRRSFPMGCQFPRDWPGVSAVMVGPIDGTSAARTFEIGLQFLTNRSLVVFLGYVFHCLLVADRLHIKRARRDVAYENFRHISYAHSEGHFDPKMEVRQAVRGCGIVFGHPLGWLAVNNGDEPNAQVKQSRRSFYSEWRSHVPLESLNVLFLLLPFPQPKMTRVRVRNQFAREDPEGQLADRSARSTTLTPLFPYASRCRYMVRELGYWSSNMAAVTAASDISGHPRHTQSFIISGAAERKGGDASGANQ